MIDYDSNQRREIDMRSTALANSRFLAGLRIAEGDVIEVFRLLKAQALEASIPARQCGPEAGFVPQVEFRVLRDICKQSRVSARDGSS